MNAAGRLTRAVAEVVSTTGLWPVTVMLSSMLPIRIPMLIVAVKPAVSWMSSRTNR